MKTVNETIHQTEKLKDEPGKDYFLPVFSGEDDYTQLKVVSFNYTETLNTLGYVDERNIIHIHGRVADIKNNPIIFGYGDESDPVYQNMEDSGENMYLTHIKSFNYFRTPNYHKLLSYIDSGQFTVFIIGHSCGVSDRILLNQIFEHKNCTNIEIFYRVKNDGTDNFTEITQEISRHFKHKDLMRRRVSNINRKNIIPQNR